MSHKTKLDDGFFGTGKTAGVSTHGQLTVGPFAHDDAKFIKFDIPDIAFNFVIPMDRHCFVITGILLKADKQVSNTVDATVVIYEAEEPDTTDVDRILFQFSVVSGDIIPFVALNLAVTVGKFINGKTDDANIHVTLMGYFRPV